MADKKYLHLNNFTIIVIVLSKIMFFMNKTWLKTFLVSLFLVILIASMKEFAVKVWVKNNQSSRGS